MNIKIQRFVDGLKIAKELRKKVEIHTKDYQYDSLIDYDITCNILCIYTSNEELEFELGEIKDISFVITPAKVEVQLKYINDLYIFII